MSNPLTHIQTEIPFDSIRAEHVEPAISELLAEARSAQRALASSTGGRTFDDTLLALEQVTEKLDWAMSVVRHMEAVATYPEFRAAYNAVQAPTAEFYSQIPLDPGLWRVLREYADTPEAAALTGVRKRFLTKTLDAFRRHGAELDDPGKKKLAELDIELQKLTTKFAENVLDSTNAFDLVITDEAKLAGLPESAREAARASAASKGVDGWRFTLHAPSYTPLMTYLDDRSTREHVWHAFATRASHGEHDNRGILARIIDLRCAKAKLLGFANFADFVLYDRMAHTGEQAQSFVRRFTREDRGPVPPGELRTRSVPAGNRRRRRGHDDALGRRLFRREATGRAVRLRRGGAAAILPAAEVIGGLFQTWSSGFTVCGSRDARDTGLGPGRERLHAWTTSTVPCWAHFYADWYPRENKRGGAWMDGLHHRRLRRASAGARTWD